MSLIERLTTFLTGVDTGSEAQRNYSPDDPLVAAVALMFHVMDADGVRRGEEKERLSEVLSEVYGAKGRKLIELTEAGEEADREAIDLYAFTRVIKRDFDDEQRHGFIEVLWEIVYADGERHELEENTVWRVAELIGVDRRDRIALRQRVESRVQTKDDEGA